MNEKKTKKNKQKMNDLIFITHCCFTSHKSLQMETTADNINVSSDEPQTFFYVFSICWQTG